MSIRFHSRIEFAALYMLECINRHCIKIPVTDVCEVTLVNVLYVCDCWVAYTCKDNPCLYGGQCVRRVVAPSSRKVKNASTTKITPKPRFKCVCRIGFYGNFCQTGAMIYANITWSVILTASKLLCFCVDKSLTHYQLIGLINVITMHQLIDLLTTDSDGNWSTLSRSPLRQLQPLSTVDIVIQRCIGPRQAMPTKRLWRIVWRWWWHIKCTKINF